MKKMWKRFVSLLLACTLLAGMLPLSASAAEKPEAAIRLWPQAWPLGSASYSSMRPMTGPPSLPLYTALKAVGMSIS